MVSQLVYKDLKSLGLLLLLFLFLCLHVQCYHFTLHAVSCTYVLLVLLGFCIKCVLNSHLGPAFSHYFLQNPLKEYWESIEFTFLLKM